MELNLNDFKQAVTETEIIYLATSANDKATIRPVSPLFLDDSKVCFYTASDSRKYAQMKENPNVAFCVGAMGSYQVEGTVEFLGSVFSEENAEINKAYRARYIGAFEEAAPGETMELNEFIVINISQIKGWIFNDENPPIPVGMGEIHF